MTGDTSFSRNLAAARKAKNLGQAEVAKRAGLDQAHLSHFECGRRKPSLDNLVRLSMALEVSIDDLISPMKIGGPPALAQTRIADALERIANTLEATQQERPNNE